MKDSPDNNLNSAGEQEIIDLLITTAESCSAKIHPDLGLDDTAVLNYDAFGDRSVWTTDSFVENTHFKFYPALDLIPVEWIGRKLFRTNLSDLSSSAAIPKAAMLSLGFPESASIKKIEDFLTGLFSEFSAHDVILVGGDVHECPVWCLQLTLVGELSNNIVNPKRDKIKAGQNLYITGQPGLSGLGYDMLQKNITAVDKYCSLALPIQKHLVPPDRSLIGRALAENFSDLAMMDCSDGVLKDCTRLTKIGNVGIDIMMTSNQLSSLGFNVSLQQYLHGGEDYELIFATDADLKSVKEVIESVDSNCPVFNLGKVTEGDGVRVFLEEKEQDISSLKSFEHFSEDWVR